MKRAQVAVGVAVIVSVAAALSAPGVGGQEPRRGGPTANGPRISVEPASFDFGKVLPGKDLEKEFRIRNFGSEELVVESVVTTCGCTVAKGYAKTIKPGATTPLLVTLRPNVSAGRFERSVLIKTNDPVNARLEVKLVATVTPGSL
jgi:hypothetical protein